MNVRKQIIDWMWGHKAITGIGVLCAVAIMMPNQPAPKQEPMAPIHTPQPTAEEVATKHLNDLGARMVANSDGLMQRWRQLGSIYANDNLVAGATQLCNGEHVAEEIIQAIGKHIDCGVVKMDEFQRKASYNRN